MYKIFYADGSTYKGIPEEAPAFGVLVILEDDPEAGRITVCNGDYYCYQEGHWYSMDFIGMVDYLAQPGMKRVLFGRIVPNDLYRKVHNAALADPEFPPKTSDGFLKSRR